VQFIGQQSIIKEVDIIVQRAIDDEHFNIALLLTANSGLGKTNLGLRIANTISRGKFLYLEADETGEKVVRAINSNNRVIFIDEIHLLKTPELLYPILDKEDKFIILSTNESSELKEPLRNRCINLIFAPYTEEELRQIVKQKLPEIQGKSNEYVDLIVKSAEENPRKITKLCIRLATITKIYQFPRTVEELKLLLSEILNIKDGLNPQEQEYMKVLSRLGMASLETLTSILGYSRNTIKYEIEPSLLYNKLIQITSKGRINANFNSNSK
jgi:Holliday junction resolvasome RuvABC ATP-dependent DNA helicase subunit